MILTSQTPIPDIKVGERHRKDLGDIDALASSIAELGLLQPVVIDNSGHLIAGFRRIEACKTLGLATIGTLIVDGLDDALKALHAERDENTCRKEFTPSEIVAMGQAIEEIEAPAAEARGRANLKQHRDDRTIAPDAKGETREKIGKALGVSGPTYQRAKAVVLAAEDPSDSAHEVAKDLVAQMDAGKVSVFAAHDSVQRERRRSAATRITGGADKSKAAVQARRENIRKLGASGHTFGQIAKKVGLSQRAVEAICSEFGIETADRNMPRHKKIDANRVVETAANDFAQVIETSLSTMEGRWSDVDPARVDGWVASLENSRQSLNRFLKFLKETTLA